MTETTLARLAARNPDREAVKAAMQPFLESEETAGTPDDVAAFVADICGSTRSVASLARNRVLELHPPERRAGLHPPRRGQHRPADIQADIERDHAKIARRCRRSATRPRRQH